MSALAKTAVGSRHYPISYHSAAVGSDAATITSLSAPGEDHSITIGHRQAALFDCIAEARARAAHDNWDDDGGAAISERTIDAAIRLLYALPEWLSAPIVTPESTGEVAFEWCRDQATIAVLTVQEHELRWAALLGDRPPVSGAAPFVRTIPVAALDAVKSVAP